MPICVPCEVLLATAFATLLATLVAAGVLDTLAGALEELRAEDVDEEADALCDDCEVVVVAAGDTVLFHGSAIAGWRRKRAPVVLQQA
jgi:hypothetical protein